MSASVGAGGSACCCDRSRRIVALESVKSNAGAAVAAL